MNLDELQSVRDRERQTDKLQQLRESFYADAGQFIQQLRTERERAAERADDPFDAPEVNRLTDEITTAEQTVEAIYEKRVGKLVKAASFAAADLPSAADGMTAEEQELFDTLVSNIKQNRECVLSVLAGEEPTNSEGGVKTVGEDPSDTTSEQGKEGITAADVMGSETPSPPEEPSEPSTPTSQTPEPPAPEPPEQGASDEAVERLDGSPAHEIPQETSKTAAHPVRKDGGTEREEQSLTQTPSNEAETAGSRAFEKDDSVQPAETSSGQSDPEVDRKTVRITDDVGTFVGYDNREYDLAENDVVSLPATNVAPLIEQDAAEQLK